MQWVEAGGRKVKLKCLAVSSPSTSAQQPIILGVSWGSDIEGVRIELFRALRTLRCFFSVAELMQSLGSANSTLDNKAKSLFLVTPARPPRWFVGYGASETQTPCFPGARVRLLFCGRASIGTRSLARFSPSNHAGITHAVLGTPSPVVRLL